jgi:putative glycosyltransferase
MGRTAPVASLSVATTIYRSAATIREFTARALAAAEAVASNVEMIVVDDGSPDESAAIVRELADRDERIVLVQLSRNFGHHRAMLCALEHTGGDLVFLIDSDLEEAPENLGRMLEILHAGPVDCVYGVQQQRRGGWFERLSGRAFYKVFNWLSSTKMPKDVSTMRLMTQRYVQSLMRFKDRNPVFIPLTVLAGYRQASYAFDKASSSPSSYTLIRRLALTLLAVTSFSGRPLVIMFAISFLLAGLGFCYLAVVVVRAMSGSIMSGWPSLMAAIMFFFSLNALFTGLIGLYLNRILEEVKDRPRTIVAEVYRRAPQMKRQKPSRRDSVA